MKTHAFLISKKSQHIQSNLYTTMKLLILSAPRGSGKSTIINYLMEQGLNLHFSVSATSRPPRGQEQNGVEYFFLTPEEFKQHIAANDFL